MKYIDASSILGALEQLPSDVTVAALKPILTKCDPNLFPDIFTSAAARGCRGLVEYLQNEMDTMSIRCALEAAARNGQVKVVALLRGLGDAIGIGSALVVAREVGCSEVVLLLTGKKPRLV
ncbi:hypothetical protein PHYSODRAFT_301116 [Phytophthora sojae]|uniref:Uncharacterized protein n=1 Tax=Phytophthora sojae (strain P6497) TaxID=1094619 RepID=G4ZF29_PHYSP|nr:hypothetical protein PHYSODRAFT_301116 [Phytophthora sojae]EGZ18460.1 hypothetical protein PHYSODRAFT_301116 [Phytophthora sojae]|eukprot:XP_009527518.1 hypothetical protein PHYSODRAFT_301116 [Phytophthora sojae]